jgi:hypothetical protein
MSATKYVEWLLAKVEEEQERARACFDADIADRAAIAVREEGGTKLSEKVIKRG